MSRALRLPPDPFPSRDTLERARGTFEELDPRDLFYRAATELVGVAIAGQGNLSTAEALAILLKTWNANFYRFKWVVFNEQHFRDIDALLARHADALRTYCSRAIEDFDDTRECDQIVELFDDFERVVGAVGAAKALHLLVPRFFPLWDTGIAAAYGITLGTGGQHGATYCTFMVIAEQQVEHVGGETSLGRNPLKALDEYNYCRFTRRLTLT